MSRLWNSGAAPPAESEAVAVSRSHGPLVAALVALAALAGTLLAVSVIQNGGLVYALDDAYIHLSIARNLVEHHVWGVSPYGFSASESSLLWPLLLAALATPFPAALRALPFVINVLAAAATLVIADRLLRAKGATRRLRIITLFALIVLAPMAAMIAGGMEHQLHALLTLSFVVVAADLVARNPERLTRGEQTRLSGLGVLLAMVRYEGLLTVATVCGLLLARRRPARSITLGALAITPAAVFAWIANRHGWSVLPNSLLLKAPSISAEHHRLATWLGYGAMTRLNQSGMLLATLGICFALWLAVVRQARRVTTPLGIFGIITIASLLLHVYVADVGWLFRYEAYLVQMAIVFCALVICELGLGARHLLPNLAQPAPSWLTRAFITIVLVFAAAPLVDRAGRGLLQATLAMNDRHLEHENVARFVRRYYDRDVVVCNDIGMLSFDTHAQLVDLYGLASMEPLRWRHRPQGYTSDDVRRWVAARGGRVAVLQREWTEVASRIPAQWTEVEDWIMPRNVVFKDTTVAFYATDSTAERRLAENLSEFSARLPKSIRQVPLRRPSPMAIAAGTPVR